MGMVQRTGLYRDKNKRKPAFRRVFFCGNFSLFILKSNFMKQLTDKPYLSVIIPMFNEEANVWSTIDR
jgi:cellulose synthase/poly-beta-1,6-N-acetylglucosamine synthase-like glycosyltransferase